MNGENKIMKEQIIIRFAEQKDCSFILRANQENVEVLSPMDLERLLYFTDVAELLLIAEKNGEPVAFLIALREGVDSYDSENYRWFTEKYEKFLYIDRIVIDSPHRKEGVGRLMYQTVFERAEAANVPLVTAEIDTKPYNEESLLFHQKMGFSEVGKQTIRGGSIEVSLQVAKVFLKKEGIA